MAKYMTSLEIRFLTAKSADVPWIVELAYKIMNPFLEEAFTGTFDWASWESDMRGVIQTDDKYKGIVELFINDDGQKIGFWWVTPQNNHIWIDAIVLNSNFQSKGIGTHIFHQIREHFNYLYPKNLRIELGVQKSNKKAIKFYEHLNFHQEEDSYLEWHNTIRMVYNDKNTNKIN